MLGDILKDMVELFGVDEIVEDIVDNTAQHMEVTQKYYNAGERTAGQRTRMEIAKNLICETTMSDDLIAKITRLDVEEIKELRDKISKEINNQV